MIFLFYNIIWFLSIILLFPFFYIYLIKTDKISFLKNYFSVYSSHDKKNRIMFHCVSVGELNGIINIIKKFERPVLITTTCIEAVKFAEKKLIDIDYKIVFYPFDLYFFVNRLLKYFNVEFVFVSEVDYWPSLFFCCRKMNIPVVILNGRMSDNTYGFYKKASFLYGKVLSYADYVFVQNKDEMEKFNFFMEKNRILYFGNLKLEKVCSTEKIKIKKDDRFIIVAGSTHWPEEKYLIDLFNENRNLKIFIAPRNFFNISEIKKYMKDKNISYTMFSENGLEGDLVIIDEFGVLGDLYENADISYIGGGFKNTGIHNFLESALCEVPFVTGPIYKNFDNEMKEFEDKNANIKVKKIDNIGQVLKKYINDRNSLITKKSNIKIIIENNQNISKKIVAFIRTNFYE